MMTSYEKEEYKKGNKIIHQESNTQKDFLRVIKKSGITFTGQFFF